jgi:hypothetical protein
MMSKEKFNIFGSENTDFLNENGHSFFLKRLLSPNGQHGQGNLFLKIFMTDVLNTPFDEKQTWSVEKEKKAGLRGRVDLHIHSKEFNIVIENKIDAEDQDAQLYRYWRNKIYGENKSYNEDFYNKSWERGILVYLTPTGKKPSENSRQKPRNDSKGKYNLFPDILPMDKIKCISYKKDIRCWLCNCLCKIDKNEHTRLYSALEQYVEWIDYYLK